MKLTRERKTFFALAVLTALALGIDRFLLGSDVSGPSSAAAGTISPYEAASSKATLAVDRLLSEPDPSVRPSLARNLRRLAAEHPLDSIERDAFAPSTAWLNAQGSTGPSSAGGDTAGFDRLHRLVAVIPTRRRPCAMVDGQPMFIGQKLDGHTLIAVRQRSAVFEANGRRVVLLMDDEDDDS
jgi:hypothetical protein